jgi:predicted Holliday junction resolvase-like endonuclease
MSTAVFVALCFLIVVGLGFFLVLLQIFIHWLKEQRRRRRQRERREMMEQIEKERAERNRQLQEAIKNKKDTVEYTLPQPLDWIDINKLMK